MGFSVSSSNTFPIQSVVIKIFPKTIRNSRTKCKDQIFSLTTVQRKTSTYFHKNACGESPIAMLLLTEDSIKNFLREFYRNSFKGITLAMLIMLLPQPRPQRKDTARSRFLVWLPVSCFGKSSIVLKFFVGILSRTRHPSSSVLN